MAQSYLWKRPSVAVVAGLKLSSIPSPTSRPACAELIGEEEGEEKSLIKDLSIQKISTEFKKWDQHYTKSEQQHGVSPVLGAPYPPASISSKLPFVLINIKGKRQFKECIDQCKK